MNSRGVFNLFWMKHETCFFVYCNVHHFCGFFQVVCCQPAQQSVACQGTLFLKDGGHLFKVPKFPSASLEYRHSQCLVWAGFFETFVREIEWVLLGNLVND